MFRKYYSDKSMGGQGCNSPIGSEAEGEREYRAALARPLETLSFAAE